MKSPILLFDREAHLATPVFFEWPADVGPCHLYLMRCERFVKVGISNDVQKRLAGLQGANPFPVTLAKTFRFSNRKYAGFAERTCHRVFGPVQAFGEWFEIDYEEAFPIVTEIVSATKALAPLHRKLQREAKAADRLRYQTDPKYRAKLDREVEAADRRHTYYVELEKVRTAAEREFNSRTTS